MIHLLYDLILMLALPVIVPYHLYRARKRGRPAALAERFGFVPPEPADGPGAIWVHAVSVGETIAVKPLLKALKEAWPERRIVLSNGTETGRAIAATVKEVDRCIYFPFDTPGAVDRLLTAVAPALVIVVETEIWPGFLHRARRRGIPVLLANGRISDRSFSGYRRFAWFFRRVLPDIAAFCMQSAEDGRRIAAIGAPADRVVVAGNLKYDIPAVTVTPERQLQLRQRFGLPVGAPVLVAGSTHKGEDEPVLAAYRQLLDQGRQLYLVLVPRHPERAAEVAALTARAGLACRLRSGLDTEAAPAAAGGVLLVDTVGELMDCFAAGDLAYVGGSLVPTGGHNILEPASLGRPVLFGPHMSNFREIASLALAHEAGRQVADGAGLAAGCAALLDDGELARRMGANGRRVVAENSGAVQRHLQAAAKLLAGSEADTRS